MLCKSLNFFTLLTIHFLYIYNKYKFKYILRVRVLKGNTYLVL